MPRPKTCFALLALVGSIPLLGLDCSPGRGQARAACDPDGDPCPKGTVCESDKDDNSMCRISRGGSCDAKAEDPFCAGGTKCTVGSDGKGICGLGLGEKCDPNANPDQCIPPAVCATD